MTISPIRIGVSRCLLGDEVRYDGGHKRDRFLTDVLGRFVEWVPVCPEVEAGLGTPREAMRLVGEPSHPQLVTIKTGKDQTNALERMTPARLESLETLQLSGYIFKKDSPSCGIERVRVFNRHGMPSRNGVGIFAQAFMRRFPLVPIEDEGRLCDARLRENFIERVFAYRRWQDLLDQGLSRHALVRFHTVHKYLLMAHDPPSYQALGRLVAHASHFRPAELARRYGTQFMKTLAIKATPRKHVNVLHHLIGHFKTTLGSHEKTELLAAIEDYRRGFTPLIVPLALIKHYVLIHQVEYLESQVYLNPHPKELMLRNHA